MSPCFRAQLLCVFLSIASAGTQASSNTPYHEKSKQIIKSPTSTPGGLFGYSVAYQSTLKSLVVGAPLDTEVGNVFVCPVDVTSKLPCQRVTPPKIKLSTKDKAMFPNHKSWFGASVNAGKSFYTACAPRHIENIGDPNDSFGTIGLCYHKNTDMNLVNTTIESMEHLSRDDKKRYHMYVNREEEERKYNFEYWQDSFGLSTYVNEANPEPEFFVSGPITSNGRIIQYFDNKWTQKPKLVPDLSLKYDMFVEKTPKFNFGYSITSGTFWDPATTTYAVSSPYGTSGYGMIYFFIFDPRRSRFEPSGVKNIESQTDGVHVGALFGASLEALRSPRNYSALLVGASTFTPDPSSPDMGAVFIYMYNEQKQAMQLIKKLLGHKKSSYFGASIICIGDYDNDNIQEVAIAAPIEDTYKGAVYVYSGRDLLNESNEPVKWIQRFVPRDSPDKNIEYHPMFGWSIARLADADDNGCNELAIGAPGNNSVTVYRCIASVNITFDVKTPNVEEQTKIIGRNESANFIFRPCFIVTYLPKPDPSKIESKVMLTILLEHDDVTMKGNNTHRSEKSLRGKYPSQTICESVNVTLPWDADYDQALKFTVSVELMNNLDEMTAFNPNLVYLNNKKHKISSEETFLKINTGSNVTYEIQPSLRDGMVIGSSDKEWLFITLTNKGSKARGACVCVKLDGVIAEPADRRCRFSSGELKCTEDLLDRGKTMTVNVTLDSRRWTSSQKQVTITSRVFVNHCSKQVGEPQTQTFNLTTDKNIMIKGFAIPSKNFEVSEDDLDSKDGKRIEHTYQIINYGVTNWTDTTCKVTVPPQVAVQVNIYPGECEKLDNRNAICKIDHLYKLQQATVKVSMKIQPGSPFVGEIVKGKATVDTEIRLYLVKGGAPAITENLTTILRLWATEPVATWIIVLAVLAGLLLLGVVIWILYTCGFLRRKNKEKLEGLKQEVKRKSMMVQRNSARHSGPNDTADREQILNSSDAENHDDPPQLNVQHVRERNVEDDDPARAAFKEELDRALGKPNQTERVVRDKSHQD